MVHCTSVLCLAFAVAACTGEALSPVPPAEARDAGADSTERETAPAEAAPTIDRSTPPPPSDEDAPVPTEDTSVSTEAGGEAADVIVSPPDARRPASYACTLVIGINATGEWYKQGFERLVDDARWELMQIHNGFIENWADPNDAYWSTPVDSPCTANPNAPDRILFVLSNFDYTTIDEWYAPLVRVLQNLQDKYPSARNIELMTWVRAPGNQPCPQAPANRSTISAGEDEAIAKAVQQFAPLVTAAPKFEAHACSEYTDNPPHPTVAGGAAWAMMIAAHYAPGP
jgi:hypothetical protein